jgi:hypothetical protein
MTMKKLIAALVLALLAPTAKGSTISGTKTNIFNVYAGTDPTKLPLAGGVETGPVYFMTPISVGTDPAHEVWLSSGGLVDPGYLTAAKVAIGYSSSTLPTPPLAVVGSDADGVGARFMPYLGTTAPQGGWVMVGSTSAFAASKPFGLLLSKGPSFPGDVLFLIDYSPLASETNLSPASATGGLLSMGDDGQIDLLSANGLPLNLNGSNTVNIQSAAGNIGMTSAQSFNVATAGAGVVSIVGNSGFTGTATTGALIMNATAGAASMTAGGGSGATVSSLNTTDVTVSSARDLVMSSARNTTITAAPGNSVGITGPSGLSLSGVQTITNAGLAASKALCINASNKLSVCTSVVNVGGGCTCP